MEDFGQGLQQLIEKTLAGKSEELKKREADVTERERRIESVKQNIRKGYCELRVGNSVFHTTCETLTSVQDSYFTSGLLDTSMIKDGKLTEPIFIDRDGDVFKFVLEYLQYGEIYTPLPSDGFRRKLLADAKYYLLPELVEQLNSKGVLENGEEFGLAYISLSSQQACANQHYVVWNGTGHSKTRPSHFTLSADNSKITIVKSGLYQVHVRLAQTNSLNTQHLGLLHDGVEIAQCLQSDGNAHQNTAQITEIVEIQAGSYIQVRCGANSNSLPSPLQSRLFILLLSE
jgi:hypothetical protein